jgi:hypothetical protein
MNAFTNDDVLLLVLDVLEGVCELSDLFLDGGDLAVVWDVDHAVDVEPRQHDHATSYHSPQTTRRVEQSQQGSVRVRRSPKEAPFLIGERLKSERMREQKRTYEIVFGLTVLISFEKQY